MGGRRGPQTDDGGAAPSARGIAVVGLAVVLGIVGLQIIDDGGTNGAESATTTTTLSTPTSSTTSSASTSRAVTSSSSSTTTTKKSGASSSSTTSTLAGRPPSQVKVYVYNGSDVSGAASTMSNKLKGLGYNTQGIANETVRTGTVVACKTGYDKEAAALAAAVGGNAKVEAFPSPAPAGSDAVDCVVILGK
jgi:cytoskeletal protein RodZ